MINKKKEFIKIILNSAQKNFKIVKIYYNIFKKKII
jgi:hypothetical protein